MKHETIETATFTKVSYTCDLCKKELLAGAKPFICYICEREVGVCCYHIRSIDGFDHRICNACDILPQFSQQIKNHIEVHEEALHLIKEAWKDASLGK